MTLVLKNKCRQAHQHKPGLQLLDYIRAAFLCSGLPPGQDSRQLCEWVTAGSHQSAVARCSPAVGSLQPAAAGAGHRPPRGGWWPAEPAVWPAAWPAGEGLAMRCAQSADHHHQGGFSWLKQALAGCTGCRAHWQGRGRPLQDAGHVQMHARSTLENPVALSPSTCPAQGHPASISSAEEGLPTRRQSQRCRRKLLQGSTA